MATAAGIVRHHPAATARRAFRRRPIRRDTGSHDHCHVAGACWPFGQRFAGVMTIAPHADLMPAGAPSGGCPPVSGRGTPVAFAVSFPVIVF
jgi:hypothetical protein